MLRAYLSNILSARPWNSRDVIFRKLAKLLRYWLSGKSTVLFVGKGVNSQETAVRKADPFSPPRRRHLGGSTRSQEERVGGEQKKSSHEIG